tara:strand:- start:1203 stop:1604 length:402 start_codon:yes stop_codon:yes gene_type:complete
MDNLINDIKQDLIDKLEDGIGLDSNVYDLHHELCNLDYFIIGTYKAKQWIGHDAFDAIEIIKQWELDVIGEVSTDFSDPEKVCNMLAYVIGEDLLGQCQAYINAMDFNETLRQHDINMIISQLKSLNAFDLVA